MKKIRILTFICPLLLLFTCGCSSQEFKDRYLPHNDTETVQKEEPKERVYMDKINGALSGFDGSHVTVSADEQVYTFDVTSATLECSHGMIAGDEISVIYEGQLDENSASNVRVLKIVDELHTQSALREESMTAVLTGLTGNTVTFSTSDGKAYTCVSTGARQYYQSGIRSGLTVNIHYMGVLPDVPEGTGSPVSAPLVKILSISDTEPFEKPDLGKITPSVSYNTEGAEVPEATASEDSYTQSDGSYTTDSIATDGSYTTDSIATDSSYTPDGTAADSSYTLDSTADQESAAASGDALSAENSPQGPDSIKSAPKAAPVSAYQKLHGNIQSLDLSSMQFIPGGASEWTVSDVSQVPCYFPGGPLSGSGVDLYYTGELPAEGTGGISVLFAFGDDPQSLKKNRIASYVSGIVTGKTADTITVRTDDNAQVTLRRSRSSDTGAPFEIGDQVREKIDPSETPLSNIF
ncbi:MAG: hypothetical protein IJ123_04005 [Blautia sp.]|nr:hypothetical protein [Blautia sp.]